MDGAEEWGDILGSFLGGGVKRWKDSKSKKSKGVDGSVGRASEATAQTDWSTWNPIYDDNDPTNDLNMSPSYSDRMSMREGRGSIGTRTDTPRWRDFINQSTKMGDWFN